jgi:predicted O-methyltransferase YrrM
MSPRTLGLSETVSQYLMQVGLREPDELRSVREDTARLPGAHLQIAPEQGQLMALLVHLTNARSCLEVGTFTGYSAMALALALPPDGRIVACEIDPSFAAMAREHWQRAGVADKVDLRLGPALGTLDKMLEDGEAGRFDLAFIDADKENILAYYERCLALTKGGGLMLIDNTLWGGSAADPTDRDPVTEALRALNSKVHSDPRVEMVLVPIGDGLTFARKVVGG